MQKQTKKPSRKTSVPTMPEVIARLEQRWTAKPIAMFTIGQVVSVPVAVCESGKARIVGVEWGPQHGKAKTDCSGWLYWLVEVTPPPVPTLLMMPTMIVSKGCTPWAASESELLEWAKG